MHNFTLTFKSSFKAIQEKLEKKKNSSALKCIYNVVTYNKILRYWNSK